MIVLIEVQERQYEEKKKGISSRIWITFAGLQKSDMEIGESYDLLCWKKPLKSSGPTINLALPSSPLNYGGRQY